MSLRQQSATEQELLNNYPGLTLEDLTIIWGHYHNNRLEIDRIIVQMDN